MKKTLYIILIIIAIALLVTFLVFDPQAIGGFIFAALLMGAPLWACVLYYAVEYFRGR